MSPLRTGLLTCLCVPCIGAAGPPSIQAQEPAPDIRPAEYVQRRARALEGLPEGILLLHARPAEKAMEQWGFVQDPSFFYFTGLSDLPGAVLALDGPTREAHLFVPPAPISFGLPVQGLVPEPGRASAERLGLTRVRAWDEFGPWVDARIAAGVNTLYVDEPRRPETSGVPDGMARVSGPLALWRSAVEGRFPRARVASAKELIHGLRARKSPAEVAILGRNARATVAALLAVAGRIEPGMTQREAEATVVATCLEQGTEGPSFWPWTMSGPNARVGNLVGAFYRYDQGNRTMRAGELVRVDIGCASGGYGGDVGRTLPVSGRFSAGQREAWDLLVEGYLAGVAAMGPGVEVQAVRAASRAAVEARAERLETPAGRQAAQAILAGGDGTWHIHGVGVESGEDALPVLAAGAVVAYEPGVQAGDDAFYLEDMIVITETGAEVLSGGLPYRADEIEAAMAVEGPGRR